MARPLISDEAADRLANALILTAFVVVGTPFVLVTDAWRWARTGELPYWLRRRGE